MDRLYVLLLLAAVFQHGRFVLTTSIISILNREVEAEVLSVPGHPRSGPCDQVVPSPKVCASDEECPAQNKCCVSDCGPICIPPALGVKTAVFPDLFYLLHPLKVDMSVCWRLSSSPQINQGRVPQNCRTWECALNSAGPTATVRAVRSAAPTTVAISAPRRSQGCRHCCSGPR